MENRNGSILRDIVEHIRRDTDAQFTVNQLAVYMEACKKDGVHVVDVAESLQIHRGSLSRIMRTLGVYVETDPHTGEKVRKGYDLIRAEPDLEDSRRLRLFLTLKGRDLFDKLQDTLER